MAEAAEEQQLPRVGVAHPALRQASGRAAAELAETPRAIDEAADDPPSER